MLLMSFPIKVSENNVLKFIIILLVLFLFISAIYKYIYNMYTDV